VPFQRIQGIGLFGLGHFGLGLGLLGRSEKLVLRCETLRAFIVVVRANAIE